VFSRVGGEFNDKIGLREENNIVRVAKFFVKENGDTVLQERGILTEQEIRKIQEFIKERYKEMYQKWSAYADTGFYGEK
jgi:hypothetical protein